MARLDKIVSMTGKNIASIAIAAALGLGLVVAPAQSATTKFTSCDKMHKVFKYGISMDKKAQARAVREGMYRPPVKPQVYEDSYKTLDRDKDGTMCEVPK
jgi:hypothetical protein